MLGWTLGRYLFFYYLKITFVFTFGSFILISILDFTENIDRLTDLIGYNLLQGFVLSFLRSPSIIEKLLPFIVLVSETTILFSLNRRFELIIMRSIGISAWNFLFPSFIGAFLLGVLAIFLLNPISVWSNIQAKNIILSWRAVDLKKIESNNYIPWFSQNINNTLTVIGTKTLKDEGRILIGATFISFKENKKIKEWINVKEAHLKNGYWLLINGTKYTIGKPPKKFHFKKILTNLKSNFIIENFLDPSTIPFYCLPFKIKFAKSMGYSVNTLKMHFQSILALPFFLIEMTLVSATVSLKFLRYQKSYYTVFQGIFIGFLLYVTTILMQYFGNEGYIPPVFAAWIPVILGTIFGIIVLLHQEDG